MRDGTAHKVVLIGLGFDRASCGGGTKKRLEARLTSPSEEMVPWHTLVGSESSPLFLEAKHSIAEGAGEVT
jgi:hypothetical protein